MGDRWSFDFQKFSDSILKNQKTLEIYRTIGKIEIRKDILMECQNNIIASEEQMTINFKENPVSQKWNKFIAI